MSFRICGYPLWVSFMRAIWRLEEACKRVLLGQESWCSTCAPMEKRWSSFNALKVFVSPNVLNSISSMCHLDRIPVIKQLCFTTHKNAIEICCWLERGVCIYMLFGLLLTTALICSHVFYLWDCKFYAVLNNQAWHLVKKKDPSTCMNKPEFSGKKTHDTPPDAPEKFSSRYISDEIFSFVYCLIIPLLGVIWLRKEKLWWPRIFNWFDQIFKKCFKNF